MALHHDPRNRGQCKLFTEASAGGDRAAIQRAAQGIDALTATVTMAAATAVMMPAIAAAAEEAAVEKVVAPAAAATGLPKASAAAEEAAVEEEVAPVLASVPPAMEGMGLVGAVAPTAAVTGAATTAAATGPADAPGGDIAQTENAAALSVPTSAAKAGRRENTSHSQYPGVGL